LIHKIKHLNCSLFTSVCRVHKHLIQSGFSHVFVVYSEPIEIYLSIYLIIQSELWILQSVLSVNGNIYFYWNYDEFCLIPRDLKTFILSSLICIIKQDIHKYVAYSRPNGLTDWAEICFGHSWVARGVFNRIPLVQILKLD